MSVLRGIAFISKSVFVRLCFTLFRITHNSAQSVWWRLTGVHGKCIEARKPENYKRSAQVRMKSLFLYIGPVSDSLSAYDKSIHKHIHISILTEEPGI